MDDEMDVLIKDLNILVASLSEHVELIQQEVARLVSDVDKFKESL